MLQNKSLLLYIMDILQGNSLFLYITVYQFMDNLYFFIGNYFKKLCNLGKEAVSGSQL